MVAPAMVSNGTAGGTTQGTRADKAATVVPAVPFIRASSEHREPLGVDQTRQLTTSEVDLGVFDVPSYGFLRNIVIEVTATGGTGTGVTLTEDAPWNVLKSISLGEPNGSNIVALNNGYELYLVNKYGGYRWGDPKALPSYSASVGTSANFSFKLRIPVEILLRDGLGSLPNQNSGATFKVRLSLGRIADVFGGTVSNAPNVRVKIYQEAWDQPAAGEAGTLNATVPPAINSTQFWTSTQYQVSQGDFAARLTRLGNYMRNMILILRRNSGTRLNGEADFPDPLTLWLDTRPADRITKMQFNDQMAERFEYGIAKGSTVPAKEAPGGLDNGVFVYDFTHEFDGKAGAENRDLWLETIGSTRLEWGGNWGNAGTLTVLTNDVSVAGSVFI